jgi:hypothetical protein
MPHRGIGNYNIGTKQWKGFGKFDRIQATMQCVISHRDTETENGKR